MNSIKELRIAKGLTQKQVSEWTGIPLRTYKDYENDAGKEGNIKYRYILEKLSQYGYVDETHGILKMDDIIQKCKDVLTDYPVRYCYLFGSYARGSATEVSDVDLLISSEIKGLQFYGLAERLRECLHKRVDLLNSEQLLDNQELIDQVLGEGKRIYVQE